MESILTAMTEPARTTLKEQFEALRAENPDWLAYTNGARVFTDERGRAGRCGASVWRLKRRLCRPTKAEPASRRWCDPALRGREDRSERTIFGRNTIIRLSLPAKLPSYDASSYNQKITAKAKTLQLRGAVEVACGEGSTHGRRPACHVVAVAWTRRWENDADAVSQALTSVEKRREQQGGIPTVMTPREGPRVGAPSAGQCVPGLVSAHQIF